MTLRQLPTINTVKNLLILIFLFVIKDCNGFTVLLNKRRSPNRVNRLQTIISNGPKNTVARPAPSAYLFN